MKISSWKKLSQREALLYALCCELYCENGDNPEIAVDENNDIFLKTKDGCFDIWHGRLHIDELHETLKQIVARRKQ